MLDKLPLKNSDYNTLGNISLDIPQNDVLKYCKIVKESKNKKEISNSIEMLIRGSIKYILSVASLYPNPQYRHEIISDTIFRVIKSIKKYDDKKSTWVSYVTLIAHNVSMTYYKNLCKYKNLYINIDDLVSHNIEDKKDPVDISDYNEYIDKMYEYIDSKLMITPEFIKSYFTEIQWQVIYMHYYLGISYDNICKQLGITRYVLKSRMFKAQEKFRELRKNYGK